MVVYANLVKNMHDNKRTNEVNLARSQNIKVNIQKNKLHFCIQETTKI